MTRRETIARDPLALAMLAAWVNIPVDQLPAEMRAHTCQATMDAWARVARAARESLAGGEETPIPLILHCPQCGLQHIDAPDERTPDWTNPPHRSHLCHGCGGIWRPADVATEGVASIATRGKSDSWPADGAGQAVTPNYPTTSMEDSR